MLAATEAVSACFEIVDSRILDWRIRVEDTVADNALRCGVYGAFASERRSALHQG
ncbi:hypothetical protein ACU4GD_05535 [Cupriavidus basilensis]